MFSYILSNGLCNCCLWVMPLFLLSQLVTQSATHTFWTTDLFLVPQCYNTASTLCLFSPNWQYCSAYCCVGISLETPFSIMRKHSSEIISSLIIICLYSLYSASCLTSVSMVFGYVALSQQQPYLWCLCLLHDVWLFLIHIHCSLSKSGILHLCLGFADIKTLVVCGILF